VVVSFRTGRSDDNQEEPEKSDQMKNSRKAQAAFGKTKRPLKIWEEAARETAKKNARLKAQRLARDAAEQESPPDAESGKKD